MSAKRRPIPGTIPEFTPSDGGEDETNAAGGETSAAEDETAGFRYRELRLRVPIGLAPLKGYRSNTVAAALTEPQAEILELLRVGLGQADAQTTSRSGWKRRVSDNAQVIQWLLDQIAEGLGDG
jgi:hypothetical protein